MVSALAAAALASCGDNSNQCGEGTHADDNGYCVADAACGPGTVADSTGQCVPDGSVICSDGTVYDPATSTCVPDDSVCGEGTVLVDGQCIDEGIVAVDAEEAAEPNDGDGAGEIAGQIDIPAIGGDGFVIHGCVDPYRDVDGNGNPDVDLDFWVFQVTGPTALHIAADGVHGLAAGYVVDTADEQLFNDGWRRFGVNLVNDKSERDVFLPKAGVYVLEMTDSRSLFLDAAGGPDACYYTTITQVALPAAEPGTISETNGTSDGSLRVLSFASGGEGDILDNLFDEGDTDAISGGLVAMKGNTYLTSSAESAGFFGSIPAETLAGGLTASDTINLVIDPVWNYALAPQPYTVVTTQLHALALPTTGTSATVTPDPDFLSFLYFDVSAAGEIQHYDMAFSHSVNFLRITDSSLTAVANILGSGSTSAFSNEFVRYLAPGRYYVATFVNGATPADTYDVTNTTVVQTATALAIGTPVNDAALPATHAAFYSFAPGASKWVDFVAGSTSGGGTTSITVFPANGSGWMDGSDGFYSSVATIPFASAGTDHYEHIFAGDPNNYIFQVTTSAPTGATTYDLSAANQTFFDLGAITAGTPIDRTGDSTGANADYARYFGTSVAGNIVTATATPNAANATLNIQIDGFDADAQSIANVNDNGNGGAETLSTSPNALGWIAFGVSRTTGTAAALVDLHVTAAAPRPYTISTGTLPFSSICPSQGGAGSVVTMFDDGSGFGTDDEGLSATQTVPFAFQLFGEDVTDFLISTNGFLGFNTASVTEAFYSNTALPNAAIPNGLVAPYWDDLAGIEICRLDTGTTMTIEWDGHLYSSSTTAVGAQTVIHSNGVIDYIYGAGHAANGVGASVGAENMGGSFGHQVTDPIAPSTSITLTPM